jgi:hypothetical protein
MKTLEKIQLKCEEQKLQTKITTKELTLFDDKGDEITNKRRHLIISIPEEREFKNEPVAGFLVDMSKVNQCECE